MDFDPELEDVICGVLSLEHYHLILRDRCSKRRLENPQSQTEPPAGLTRASCEQSDHGVFKRPRTDPASDSSGPASEVGPTRKPPVRTIYSPQQLAFLQTAFQMSPYADRTRKAQIAQVTGVPEHAVMNWFENRRRLPRRQKPSPHQPSLVIHHHPADIGGEAAQAVLPNPQQTGAALALSFGGRHQNQDAAIPQPPLEHGLRDPQAVSYLDALESWQRAAQRPAHFTVGSPHL